MFNTFLSFYEEFHHRVYAYILTRVNYDHALAEDLTSEVFLKALEHFSDFDQQRSFSTWIFTIASRHLFNFFAKKKTASLEELNETEEIPDHGDEKILAEIDAKLLTKQIGQEIAQLSDSERELISLRYYADLSYEEISQLTGKQEGTIRTALHRTLQKLKHNLSSFYTTTTP